MPRGGKSEKIRTGISIEVTDKIPITGSPGPSAVINQQWTEEKGRRLG